ncbi:hypothetical protein JMJ77_0008875 [Colletotrichum scovillei]|uniref:Uncharacterized protein n=1 Tax=Colletotrichum scovillei TaxID=1209932 RepID=A0A9P7U3Z9_9PEZI|nr:hypothetical protein JMJ78_0001732 [Colletotrichum scovillei]KAG7041171.1 hypothetical protein JMJ77_0008875 [Colletotrichum scovillei]KAG7061203.1 hypothetical protein JMJ76_0010272 [Colletotrichum scovillei]
MFAGLPCRGSSLVTRDFSTDDVDHLALYSGGIPPTKQNGHYSNQRGGRATLPLTRRPRGTTILN